MRAKIFLYFLLSFLLGSMVAPLFVIEPKFFFYLSVLFFIVSFIVFSNKYFWGGVFAFGLFFLAVSLFQNQTIKYMNLNEQALNLGNKFEVMVDDIPVETEHGKATKVRLLEQIDEQKAVLYFNDNREISFGDILVIEGKIKRFNEDKKPNLIKQKVIGEISASKLDVIGSNNKLSVRGILFEIRTSMNKSLARLLPNKEAGLASGLILGEKALISADLKRNLQASGTTHVIALSGYNITIILSIFTIIKNRFSRLANLVIPFLFAGLFIVMTGASASIVRAGIMGLMPALAKYIGRPKNSIIALLFSASVMVAFNPYILLYDVGFQLSFAAMIGLIFITPIIRSALNSKLMLFQILSETLGAQIAVLPLIVYYFGQVSIISPISNLLILSLVPIGMLASFLVGFLGIILPVIGRVLAIPTFIVLKIFYLLIEYFGSLPFASIQFKVEQPFWILIIYFLIFDLIFIAKKVVRSHP